MRYFRSSLWLLVAAVILLLFTRNAPAQERFLFDPEIPYDSTFQSPSEFLGYELGSEFTFHHRVVDYFEYLDKASHRLTLQKYGETYEGRGLYYAAITSERNQNRAEQHRRNNLRLAHPDSLNEAAVDLLVDSHPITVWLSYNVHGNEPSSSEAAMQTAYRLVAGSDGETRRFRENAITIIDPMINPDGRDRYVYWYKSAKSNVLNRNAEDYEHDEPWPGGRTNHYWFDLNRDWVWLVHPESQGRVRAYQQWLPQVHLDLHEQGFNSNYFTMPGTTPRNHELPEGYEKWADVFGKGVIEEFDRHNINYATGEAFDFFYPGYGSSYPSTMGAIGMLAEQGGHSRGGRAVKTDDGYTLTLRQRIFDHYLNSIATIRTSVNNRESLLRYFRNAFLPASKKGDIEAFILNDNPDDYTYEVIALLLKHGVEVERATEDFTVGGAYDYWDGEERRREFGTGSFIIPTDQPRHVLVQTLMKRQLAIRDSVMYDMATWSIPLAYNLDAAWTTDSPDVRSERIREAPERPAGVENGAAGYAYVVDWAQRNAPKALSKLWEAGYRVRSAEKPFTYRGKTFSRGSLIVLKGRNYEKRGEINDDMQRIAKEAHVRIEGFDTGRMDEGIDLASRSSEPVERPDVALLVDRPMSSYTAGQIWFLFDRWTEFGISRIRTGELADIDLQEYDVLIIPNSRESLVSAIDSTRLERLKLWVSEGGTLIGTEGGAEFLAGGRSGITPVELVEDEAIADSEETGPVIDPAAYTRYEMLEDSAGLRRIPGSAFQGVVDNSHPLAFGMPDRLYTLKFSEEAFRPTTGWQTVGYYAKDPDRVLVSGYASEKNRRRAAGNSFAGVYDMGEGKVVFLLDNTQYRMFWLGPARMMQNAVMLLHDL